MLRVRVVIPIADGSPGRRAAQALSILHDIAAADYSGRAAVVSGAGPAVRAGPVDLLIAATAEREGLIVLCDDHDFQTVASVTGQPVKLVADL